MSQRLHPQRFERAVGLARQWAADDQIPGICAAVGSSTGTLADLHAGRHTPAPLSAPIRPDAIFLIASPTKPITALAILMLVEEGRLQLSDAVADFVPEFGAIGKRSITVLHCLTHTSGLCDMLPNNSELRSRQAPLADFMRHACELKADFLPGRGVQYSSMAYLMLGEIVARVSGMPLREFLKRRVFAPLAMHDTELGMPPAWEQTPAAGEVRARDRIAGIRMSDHWPGAAVHWNGDYWRRLGVPWGGILSTTGDLANLYSHLLAIHRGREGLIGRHTLEAMTTNQLAAMPEVPETHRRCFPWGLGWQLHWPAHPTSMGDLLSPRAYGHWGATGSLVWIDPERDAFLVVLCSEPLEPGRRLLTRMSNAVCAAFD